MKRVTLYKFTGVGILFVMLAAIRFLEGALFYDPLLSYFEHDYLDAVQLPAFSFPRLLLSVSFRYWLNGIVSLLILYIAFQKIDILKFALLLMAVAFIILIVLYGWVLINYDPEHHIALFYIRRFLLQPLMILLLLPAFYYQSRQ